MRIPLILLVASTAFLTTTLRAQTPETPAKPTDAKVETDGKADAKTVSSAELLELLRFGA